jgi:hypothetical protein
MLERIFLAHQVEAVDAPKSLILTGRCREDDSRRGHKIRGLYRRDPSLALRVDINVDMAYRCDALLRALPAARAKWIGGDIDVRTVRVLVAVATTRLPTIRYFLCFVLFNVIRPPDIGWGLAAFRAGGSIRSKGLSRRGVPRKKESECLSPHTRGLGNSLSA